MGERADHGPTIPAVRKVFGIGLHKTSTTSLANALYALGYRVGGTFSTAAFPDRSALERFVLDEAARYDAVQDMPWPVFYRLLDEHFPGSKFILTVRDPDRWIQSVVTHFGTKRIASHEYIYGVPTAQGHEDRYLEFFAEHNEQVRTYFADRPDDLLVMDVSAGDGWEPLCSFLGVPVPGVAFPRQNQVGGRRATRWQRHAKRTVRAGARRIGLPIERFERRRVGAIDSYAAFHGLCRRLDAVVPLADGGGAASAPLAAMVGDWLRFQLQWTVDAGAIADPAPVTALLESGRLADAWGEVRFATRQWAANLTDEGFGATTPDGADATGLIRTCINEGLARWGKIAAAAGLVDYEPVPDMPLHSL